MPPPSSSPPSSAAFPRGAYAKYKRATAYFLAWLVDARGAVPASTSTKVPLEVYDAIVDAIATDPVGALTPALLQRMPRALEAGASAVTLRTRVALFLGDVADDAHAHFRQRMAEWLRVLRQVHASMLPVAARDHISDETSYDFSNYYDVLALPDDYFMDESDAMLTSDDTSDAIDDAASSPATQLVKTDHKRLDDEEEVDAFVDDVHTELAYLFMELDELSEAVYAAFHDVKTEKKTLVDATAVAKVAIDCAVSAVANLQVRYPTVVHDGRDLAALIEDRLSLEKITQLVTSVQTAWMPTDDAANGPYQYVAGTILVDIVSTVAILGALSNRALPRFEPLGQRYDEATTRHFVVPEWGHLPPLLLFHLPHLLNVLADLRDTTLQPTSGSLEAWFLGPFDTFNKTGTVSFELIFRCICWIRSVAGLQGDRTLVRTVSLSISHTRKLKQRLRTSITGTAMPLSDNVDELVYEAFLARGYMSPQMRVNPVLAGCMMLDRHERYLSLGHEALASSLFRPFCHVYAALRDRGLLDAITLIDDTIHVHETTVFSSARDGSFVRSFLASNDLNDARLGRRASARTTPRKSGPEKSRVASTSRSHVVRLLYDNDFSVVGGNASASYSDLLAAVATLCHDELFGSRSFSRDTLRLSEDTAVLFMPLCEVLDRRAHFDKMLVKFKDPVRAFGNAVVLPLLQYLDAPGNADLTASVHGMSGDMVRQAASIISSTFSPAQRVEKRYFMFPATPAWVSTEFSSLSPAEGSTGSAEDEFKALAKILTSARKPLRGEELHAFKRRVVATPAVLTMVSSNPKDQLWSLLHHVAAGKAEDLRLAEWLIQMGALVHNRPQTQADAKIHNELAVHCAAIEGNKKMVKLILEACSFRDLNTTTLDTKEAVIHLAVRGGHKELVAWLVVQGAKSTMANASGKYAWELASDHKWASSLREACETEMEDDERRAKDDDFGLPYQRSQDQMEHAVECARQGIHAGRIPTRSEAGEVSKDSALASGDHHAQLESTKGGKRNKKRKGRKKATTSAPRPPLDRTAIVTKLMGQLFVQDDENADASADKIEMFTDDLERLDDKSVSNEAREACSARVLSIFDHFEQSINTIVASGILSRSAAVMQEAEYACWAVFKLATFEPNFCACCLEKIAAPGSSFASLYELVTAAVTPRFCSFFGTMMKTSLLIGYCRQTKAQEAMLKVMENHLLSIKVRPTGFREMVWLYFAARAASKANNCTTGPIPPELEWYTSNHGIHNVEVLYRMDMLTLGSHYAKLRIVGGQEPSAHVPCRSLTVLDAESHGGVAVVVADEIVACADSKEDLFVVVAAVLDAARESGQEVQYADADLDQSSVVIHGFEFSASSVVRKQVVRGLIP